MNKKLLSLVLLLSFTVLHASDDESDPFVDTTSHGFHPPLASGQETLPEKGGSLVALPHVADFWGTRKPKGSNSSFTRWAGTILSSTGIPYAPWLGAKLASADEFRGVSNADMSYLEKGLIALLLLGLDTPFTPASGGATGLQKGTERLLGQLQQRSVFVPSDRGRLRFDAEQFSALRRDPDFQATTNGLLYALMGELGVSLLGTLGGRMGGIWSLLGLAEELGFAKDLLLPLLIFRSRYGHALPSTSAYLRENTIRYTGKRVLSFVAGDEEKFAKDFLSFCAEGLSLLGLVSSKTPARIKDEDIKLKKLFEEWMLRILGKASKHSASVMNSAQDCFVNLGTPRSLLVDMQGLATFIDVAKERGQVRNSLDEKTAQLSFLQMQQDEMIKSGNPAYIIQGIMLGLDIAQESEVAAGLQERLSGDIFLAKEGTPLYKQQFEGYGRDIREEIAGLRDDVEKNAKLLQTKRSALLGWLTK